MKHNFLLTIADMLGHPEWCTSLNLVRRYLKDFDYKNIYKYENPIAITPQRHTKIVNEAGRYLERAAIRGAKVSELTRLVKYSLIVLDAQKHFLNYQKARADFGIDELVDKYDLNN